MTLQPNNYSNGVQSAHAILLHTGRVLVFSYIDNDPNTCDMALWNPADGTSICVATHLDPTDPNGDPNHATFGHDWMCTGHTHISSGALPIFGSNHAEPMNLTSLYIPDPNGGKGTIISGKPEAWPLEPNEPPSDVNRFYPTVTALPRRNGKDRVLITDGTTAKCGTDAGSQTPTIVELDADPNNWVYKPLYGARYEYDVTPPSYDPNNPNDPNFLKALDMPTYPHVFLT